MRHTAITLLIAFFLINSESAFCQKVYPLSGEITNLDKPATLYLHYSFHDTLVSDSVIMKDGHFKFNCKVDYPVTASLSLERSLQSKKHTGTLERKLIYLEPKEMRLSTADSIQNLTVIHSVLNEEYDKLKASLMPGDKEYDRLAGALGKLPETNQVYKIQREQLIKKIQDNYAERQNLMRNFVANNPNSLVSLQLIQSLAGTVPDIDKTFSMLAKLSVPVKTSPQAQKYTNYLNTLAPLAIGKIAPLFTQPDTSGKPISLLSLRGKYVLIDFWASWCAPCRAENPNLVKSYGKFHSKGLEIIAVSLDRLKDKHLWLKAIHDDGLTWLHVSDLKFWDNQAAVMYSVQSVPQNYLLDPNGKIIAKDLRGDALDVKLAELLH